VIVAAWERLVRPKGPGPHVGPGPFGRHAPAWPSPGGRPPRRRL